jgi:hypothetical protein
MVDEAYGWANSHRSHWVGLFRAEVQLLPTFAPPTHFLGIDSGHDSRMIVSSTCYQRPSFLWLAIACGFTTRASTNSTAMGMACVGVNGHLLPLFGTSSHWERVGPSEVGGW